MALRKRIKETEDAARDAVEPDARAEYVNKLKQMQLEVSAWQSGGTPLRQDSTARLPQSITLDVLRLHFEKPIVAAAKVLGICTETLRKEWRRNGLTDWPYRHLKMLRKRIKEAEGAARKP